MLTKNIPLFSRWITIFFIFLFSYLSGFVEVQANDQLFLRHKTSPVSKHSVKGSKTSIRPTFINSQVAQVGIEIKKDDSSPTPVPANSKQTAEWGSAKQLDTYTWTIKVGQDARTATPQEILTALNSYRQKNGRGALTWDDKLGNYAKERAASFTAKGNLDSHAGFTDYVNNQDGFHKLGFGSLGENSSYGYTLEGVHLIEWVYAGDKPHNDNQLSSNWSYVGIGVDGIATDLVFGGNRL